MLSSRVIAEVERIPGTKVSIAAPVDFVPATEFQGFTMPGRGASIVVYEIQQPMRAYKENFTPEAIEQRNLTFAESNRLTVDSYDGLLVRATDATGDLEYEVLMLVFGEIRRSVVLLATYPKRDAFEFRTRVSESLMSAEWDPGLVVPTQEGLPFEIDESSRLKISSRFPDTLIFTEGGRERTSMESPILVVRSTEGLFDFGNLEAFSLEQIENSEVVEELADLKGTLKSVDQMPGYEMTAHGIEPRSGASLTIYQLVLGEEGSIFILQGFVGDSQSRTFLDEFRKVAESLRRIR